MTRPGSPELRRLADATLPARVGRYEVLHVLGSGAMATVYLGRLRGPTGFSRLVAIKRPHAHVARDPLVLAMLLDEARVTARIRHANIAQTLDVIDDEGALAVVMEYVEGPSLLTLFNDLARRNSPMPVGVAVSIAWGILNGLHAAHEAKSEAGEPLHIVHRDVSASNVLIGVDGVVRLLDFGVAKARDRLQPSTEQGGLKGTYAYMAPEQARDLDVDRRADVYAAAVLLWQCIAGRRLWQATDPRAVLSAALFDTPPSLPTLRPEVDPSLDALIQRGLQKDPADRFGTARAMASALEERGTLMSSASLSEWLALEVPHLVAGAAPPPTADAAPDDAPAAGSPERDQVPLRAVPRPLTTTTARTRFAVAALALVIGALGARALPGCPGPASLSVPEVARAPASSPTIGIPVPTSMATEPPSAPLLSDASESKAQGAPARRVLAAAASRATMAVDAAVSAPMSPSVNTSQAPEDDDAGLLPPHRRPGVIPDKRR